MKKIMGTILVAGWMISAGQGFVEKTNEIQLDFKKGIPNTPNIPVISWTSPRFEYTNSTANQVNVQVTVSSVRPLKAVRLTIGDNTSGAVIAEKDLTLTNDKSLFIKQAIKLSNGSSYIKITAENADGAISSSSRTVVVGMDAVALSIDRKDYALLFATDKYDYWDDLVNPIEDAHALARELKERYNFEVEIVENAEQNTVFEKIREYNERKYKPQDQLFVFFAGHGHFDDTFGEGFVVAKNSLMNDKAKTTFISHNRLRGIINNIPCEHILLAMDVCFGGTLDPEIAKSRNVEPYVSDNNEMLLRKLSVKTRKYLTSGGKEYVSDGIPGKHSPFASKFIESLRNSGGTDRVLTLQELILNMEVLKQVPRSGSFGDDQRQSDFVFIAKQ
jgi:Caspase domain